MKVRKRWKQEFYDFLMLSSRNCDHSFSRCSYRIYRLFSRNYYKWDSFIHLYISCMYFTDFLYCLYSAWIQARDSASTVQSIPADSGCTVATVCLRVNQSKTSILASSTRHARSETFNKNSVHSGLFGLLLYFRVHWWKNSTKPSEINERRPNARVGRTRYQTAPRDQFLPLRHIHDAFVFH